jgi:methylmalonyl-CoA carboxyltransferase 12S subunit
MMLFAQLVLTNSALAVLIGLMVAGCFATYLIMRRTLNRTIQQLRGEWATEISSLMIAARLEGKSSASTPIVAPLAAAQTPTAATAPAVASPAVIKREEVAPEMVLVIAAAVTAFLGKKVRIRSAKILYSHESFNPWSQQGRAVVQASHNVAQRVH